MAGHALSGVTFGRWITKEGRALKSYYLGVLITSLVRFFLFLSLISSIIIGNSPEKA